MGANAANGVPAASLTAEAGRLRVRGEMSFATVPALHAEAFAAVRGADGTLTIDFGEVSRADSAGLALIIEWRRLAQAAGRTVVLANMPAQLQRLIEVSGVNGILR